MRRLLALLVLLAFAAATAAPAAAACRMRAARDTCCCPPPPDNALCAPDCCERVHGAARPIGDLPTHARGFVWLPARLQVARSPLALTPRARVAPAARSRVGLHERAAPRLPLRV